MWSQKHSTSTTIVFEFSFIKSLHQPPNLLCLYLRFPEKWRVGSIESKHLQGNHQENGKIHFVNWAMVCKDKMNGGLVTGNLDYFNKTLLGKWWWRCAHESDSLWRRIIHGKFRKVDVGWCTQVKGVYDVGLWKILEKDGRSSIPELLLWSRMGWGLISGQING